jgi:5-methylcytosine-specific restriction endonuclease McrA
MGHEIRMGSQRYELFKEKGCTCVKCGIVGTFFALEKPVDRDGKGHHKNFHFNLYGINKKGEEVMLTKDHILPKSKGGTSLLSNYQTMCYQCNCEKGNKESDYYPPRDTELETAKRMVRLLLRSVLRS